MYPSSPLQNSGSFLETRVNTSLAIPMPASHMKRTESEVQLHENTAVAEYRDQCMFNRVVRGNRDRQQQRNVLELSHDGCDLSRDIIPNDQFTSEYMEETEISIGNIVSTRSSSEDL